MFCWSRPAPRPSEHATTGKQTCSETGHGVPIPQPHLEIIHKLTISPAFCFSRINCNLYLETGSLNNPIPSSTQVLYTHWTSACAELRVSIPRVKHALAVHCVNSAIASRLLTKLFWTIKQASTKSVHNLELHIQVSCRLFTQYFNPHNLVLLPKTTAALYQAGVTSLLDCVASACCC